MSEKNWKRRVVTILLAVIIIAFVVPFVATMLVYETFFPRAETQEPYLRSVEEFDGLSVDECAFVSDSGQKLAGYTYRKTGVEPQAVLVLAHGMGDGGQNAYMGVADYFAGHGFLVFAYDATGNDKSEGESMRGLPQGVVDLDQALRYVKADEDLGRYPIVLFGHGWGAYAVGCALAFHPEVKAVASLAGFNRSADMIKRKATSAVSVVGGLLTPYAMLYERLKFGSFARCTAVDGFERSDADVMIIQSADDATVPVELGYDRFYERFNDNDRFRFKLYEAKGHRHLFYSEASQQYIEAFNREMRAYYDEFEDNPSKRTDYIREHFDKQLGWELDEACLNDILTFYRESLGG